MKITDEMRRALRPFVYGTQIDPVGEAIAAVAPLILEEAAKVAENERLENEPYNHENGAYNTAVEHIAEAIRTFAQTKKPDPT